MTIHLVARNLLLLARSDRKTGPTTGSVMTGYEKPMVTTLDSREVLEMLGPAQAMASGTAGFNPTFGADFESQSGGGAYVGRR